MASPKVDFITEIKAVRDTFTRLIERAEAGEFLVCFVSCDQHASKPYVYEDCIAHTREKVERVDIGVTLQLQIRTPIPAEMTPDPMRCPAR